MEWIDSDRFLHIYPNPDLEGSENGPLFTAEYHLLCKLLRLDLPKYPNIEYLNRDGVWYTTSVSNRERISHDNCTGIYILNFLHNKNISNLPIIDWGRGMFKDVSHPRDIAFYSLMKMDQGKLWINIPLLLFYLAVLFVSSMVSCVASRERTSGKMMWWLRWTTLGLHSSKIVSSLSKMSWWVCEKILIKAHGTSPMVDISAIYFKEENHPVRRLFRELYGLE